MRFLCFLLAAFLIPSAAAACSCMRLSAQDRPAFIEAMASEAWIVRGTVAETANASARRGELIRVTETLVGPHQPEIRLWRAFTEQGMWFDSCSVMHNQVGEEILEIVFRRREPEAPASNNFQPRIMPNAPSASGLFVQHLYCSQILVRSNPQLLAAIIARARELGRARAASE